MFISNHERKENIIVIVGRMTFIDGFVGLPDEAEQDDFEEEN